MAAKKKPIQATTYGDPPEKITNTNFFGIIPDPDQKKFIDAVWKREKKLYMVDSIAGSGKSLLSTALGVLMVKYGLYSKIVYITFPGINEKELGFLPGTLVKKVENYFQPLYDALLKINEDPNRVCYFSNDDDGFGCAGDAYIECAVPTYMRGINIDNAFVIIDESENADLHTLAKVLSRINDSCITLMIGHSGQCDMEDVTKSGFDACIKYHTTYHPDICESFTFRENHRGWVSQLADLMLAEYKEPQYGFVYMTKNKLNGKLYIGQHKRTMDKDDIDDSWYLGSGKNLRKDILEFGEENFERTILYECNSQSKLSYMERVFINYYNAVGDDKFYNITSGGGNEEYCYTEEVKEKMRHKHKPMSEEARKHMAREFSKEVREAQSRRAKEKLTGYVHSEESKQHMSAAHLGSKSMYKDGVYKNVPKENIEKYLDDGWMFKCPRFNYVWMNNGEKATHVKNEDIEKFLEEGWVLGKGTFKRAKDKIEVQISNDNMF